MSELLPKRLEYLWQRRDRIDHGLFAGFLSGSGAAVYLDDSARGVHTYVTGVSGSGKSRFLQALLFQDIAKGHPLCLIDPMGDLYRSVRDFLARLIEEAIVEGFELEEVLEDYVFLDLAEEKPSVFVNPLEPMGTEGSEQQVDDLLVVLERFFKASLEEQRRLRNILKGAFLVTAELNRLPPEKRPELPPRFRVGNDFPLNLFFAADFLNMTDTESGSLLAALPDEFRFRRQFETFFNGNDSGEKSRLIQSSFNALPHLLDDSEILKVFGGHRSTIHLEEILRKGKTLLCHLPIGGNRSGRLILGRFITTKLQQAAYRRPESEWKNSYHLYLDEFHHFTDQAFADAMTNLRKYGLRVTNAHQSQTQPPFDTSEGQALLNTIKANSRIKAVFQLYRPDAELIAKDLFSITAPELSHHTLDETETLSEARTTNVAYTFTVTEGTAKNWSRSSTQTLGRTQTLGIGRTFGTNIGKTLTQGIGGSLARSLSESISRSESEGINEAYNESLQMSVAIGKNWSQVRDRRRGLTLTFGENASFAEQEGWDRGLTLSDQQSETATSGLSRGWSDSQGTNLARGENGSVAYYDSGIPRTTTGQNSSETQIQTATSSQGENYSRAVAILRGASRALSEKHGTSATVGRKVDESRNIGEGMSFGTGGSLTETESRNIGSALGRSAERARTASETKGLTETDNWQDSVTHAFSLLDQVSKTYSEALQESWSTGQTIGSSEHRDLARAEQYSEAETHGRSFGRTRRPVYFSLEEKREIGVNRLQRLGVRRCYISRGALEAELLETPFVPDDQYSYRTQNFPRIMLELQRQRLEVKAERKELPSNVLKLDAKRSGEAPEEKEEDWPFED